MLVIPLQPGKWLELRGSISYISYVISYVIIYCSTRSIDIVPLGFNLFGIYTKYSQDLVPILFESLKAANRDLQLY